MRKNPLSDLKGMLDLIKASNNPFAPIVEAINNSLESIFKLDDSYEREITIHLRFNDQDDNSKLLDFIEIKDTGAGFNDESFERFERLLDRTKGFNNRGSGRLQYLHRFGEVTFKSIYCQDNDLYLRKFSSSKDNFIYDDSAPQKVDADKLETSVTLKHLRSHKQDQTAYTTLKFGAFVSWIKSQFALRAYLDKCKGKSFPSIKLQFSYQVAETENLTIEPDNFPEPSAKGSFE
ncbi:ATP-binding protein, partial [Pseudoalteromonas lipolytica]|uniref:ATP-binding protein n=1 Tax=Pseudoalteromonas lipolytica TaxID=570156 RepID=UPI00241D3E25